MIGLWHTICESPTRVFCQSNAAVCFACGLKVFVNAVHLENLLNVELDVLDAMKKETIK